MREKIILIPSNTDLNRGDQALVWESINVIRDVYNNPNIILMKGNEHKQYAQTEKLGYPMISRILKHPNRVFFKRLHIRYSALDIILIGIVALFDFITSSLLLIRSKWINKLALLFMSQEIKDTFAVFKNCDAVYVKGGGFIHSYGAISDAYQMYFLLYHILLAIRHKKKVFVLPNSIGPLKSKLAGWLADYALNHCTYLSVRESISEQFLLSRKRIKTPVHRHADLGFFLKSDENFKVYDYLSAKGLNSLKPIVGITLRPYRFPGESNPRKKYNEYLKSFVALAKHLEKKGYQVVLFSHTLGPGAHENDTIAVKQVSALLDSEKVKHLCIEDFNLNCRKVMAIYSRFTVLVGTRFHSVIFAQNSFVPTIAVAYGGNKGIGIMKDAGLPEFSIPMNSISGDKLVSVFDRIENGISTIKEKLKENRIIINKDRNEMVKEIKLRLL